MEVSGMLGTSGCEEWHHGAFSVSLLSLIHPTRNNTDAFRFDLPTGIDQKKKKKAGKTHLPQLKAQERGGLITENLFGNTHPTPTETSLLFLPHYSPRGSWSFTPLSLALWKRMAVFWSPVLVLDHIYPWVADFPYPFHAGTRVSVGLSRKLMLSLSPLPALCQQVLGLSGNWASISTCQQGDWMRRNLQGRASRPSSSLPPSLHPHLYESHFPWPWYKSLGQDSP